ncbi:hypothetical protein [Agrobacterium sp. SORGH_AS 787]|uniref:hypothetical protein n=1 Tax=Agrobacterium sp. SORGH_AS 787 TaxID=3041775 RepID=UPI00278B6E2A|nr:hypothetical protein [Rhizobium sp. SORGH_AS_0787]
MKSIIFLDANLRSHSAATKSGKSIIKIELETVDHYELADILRQLDKIDVEQKAASKLKAGRT